MEHQSAVLVANGPLEWSESLHRLCAESSNLFAADGGANHLARIGLRPAAVIGDLDSLRPSVRAWLGESALIHRPDQNRTDLDKATGYLFEEAGFSKVIVLGALGARIDHEIGNLTVLGARCLGKNFVFQGIASTLIAASGTLDLGAQPGEIWSFWTFDPAILVTVSGVRWSFERTSLNTRPSISNIADTDTIEVIAEGGPVFIRRQKNPAEAG
jgi:thiamine pyrophosphokinase